MLTQQLRQLEGDGIVTRIVHAEVPPKVEYHLTEWGQSLCPALDRLLTWAEQQRHRMTPTAQRLGRSYATSAADHAELLKSSAFKRLDWVGASRRPCEDCRRSWRIQASESHAALTSQLRTPSLTTSRKTIGIE